MNKTHTAALLLGMATLAGVGAAQVSAQQSPTVTTQTPVNTVKVENERKMPVTVYMDYGQFDRRLGKVPALKTATLPLPSWAVRGQDCVHLFVHPEGGMDDLATQDFSLQPPAQLTMVVPPRGNMSSTADTMSAVIPPEELADATLTVDNPRGKFVTVFAEQGDFDVRLGQVPAHGSATLRFPKSLLLPDQSIQIFVQPDGGIDLASETLQVRRGEHLGLKVPLH